MEKFKIFFKESVWKDFKYVPKNDVKKIMKKIESLHNEPRPHGSEKISGYEKYRIRQGRYRIIYSIQDKELTIWVFKIGHRKEVYRHIKPGS